MMTRKRLFMIAVSLGGLVLGFLLNRPARSAVSLNISLEQVASGFTRAVDIVSAGDSRIFIVEQDGRVKIVQPSGTVLPDAFLDISARVQSPADGSNLSERGLLSLAFHPEYAENGYFYVLYTRDTNDSGEDGDLVVSRFGVSANADLADPGSESVMLIIDHPRTNHNGGSLEFGPDGFLYISIGDGGGGGDPDDNGQKLSNLLGKILRIDVDSSGGGAPDTCSILGGGYTVPADNPFADGANGDCDEIWAWGLRNPWRFSFDSLTGDMFIGDVGQAEWEELNFQPASSTGGENYGWDCYEGTHLYSDSSDSVECGDVNTYVMPIFEYQNFHNPCASIIGGEVYRGVRYPELVGHYLFLDYCTPRFWSAFDNAGNWEFTELGDIGTFYRSFGLGHSGEMYLVSGSALFHIAEDTLAPADLTMHFPIIWGADR